MPPRRTSARQAAAATSSSAPPSSAAPAASTSKPPSSRAKKGKKRAASVVDEEEEDKEGKEDDQPAQKKAKLDVDDKPAKMVKVVQRGTAVPVDPNSGYVGTHEVYTDGEETYDAMLNQTQIKANSNKFYAIQLLHPIGNSSSAFMFTRWGRVGEDGQTQQKGPWPISSAVREFYKQYKSKTGSDWSVRHNMVPKPGKYIWIERDFGEDKDEAEKNGTGEGEGKEAPPGEPTPEVVAKPPVQDLVRLIFNKDLMDAHLKELNYDANKLPLGKMSKGHILQGFEALKKLGDVINDPDGPLAQELGGFRDACDTLSGRYYSIIPHLFNRNTRPISINSKELLKREVDLVDALGDMSIATKLIQTAEQDGKKMHPIDSRVEGLNLDCIEALDHASQEFEALQAYLHDTHGATHSHLRGKIQEIFRVKRAGESDRFEQEDFHNLEHGKRRLLWHGSRTTNFGGILSQGLRIAPPEAPVSGYMFGKGVYFADASSKSLGYTYHHLSQNTGLLLLCEVAVDPVLELTDAAYDADNRCKNADALATKGIGRTQPTDWQDAADATGNEDLRGISMPKGRLQRVSPPGAYLEYNEYIVYNTAQVRLRYLLRVKF